MERKIAFLVSYILVSIMLCGVAMAGQYTLTGDQDFGVYIDANAYLGDKVYATVSIDQSLYPGDAKCVDMIFFKNASALIHIQSNPPLADTTRFNMRQQAITPEEKGYFDIKDGVGTIYFRDKDIVPYNNFTFVVLCNVGNQSLVYEENNMKPIWREAFKALPARGAWLADGDNAAMIIIVLITVGLIVMFIWAKWR